MPLWASADMRPLKTARPVPGRREGTGRHPGALMGRRAGRCGRLDGPGGAAAAVPSPGRGPWGRCAPGGHRSGVGNRLAVSRGGSAAGREHLGSPVAWGGVRVERRGLSSCLDCGPAVVGCGPARRGAASLQVRVVVAVMRVRCSRWTLRAAVRAGRATRTGRVQVWCRGEWTPPRPGLPRGAAPGGGVGLAGAPAGPGPCLPGPPREGRCAVRVQPRWAGRAGGRRGGASPGVGRGVLTGAGVTCAARTVTGGGVVAGRPPGTA